MNILRLRNNIDINYLLSSTTYKTDSFDKCIYCHKKVENDYYEYNGDFIGMPFRCKCEDAQKELDAKKQLLEELNELQKNIDVNTINKITKEALLNEIERAYEENSDEIINSIFHH